MTTFKRSIKRRVFIILGVSTLLLSLVHGALIIFVAYFVEDETLEKLIRLEAGYIETTFQETGEIVQPRWGNMAVHLNEETLPAEIRKSADDSSIKMEVFTDHEEHYHLRRLNLNVDEHAWLVANVAPLLSVSSASADLLQAFLLAFIIVLIIALLFAYRITLLTVRPVVDLAGDVEKMQKQEGKVRLSSRVADDEIGFLANTIENSLNELREAIKREIDFSSDLSHELRTPLTIMTNSLSLASQRSLRPEEILLLKQTVHKFDQIVATLLALARSELVETETIALRSLIEECVLTLHQKISDSDLDVTLQMDDRFTVSANRQLIVLLINNLIENAIAHASEKKLVICLSGLSKGGASISFENLINKRVADNVVKQSVKSADSRGQGQGLYLVKRIVEALNWRFDILSNDSQFAFVLFLPPTDHLDQSPR